MTKYDAARMIDRAAFGELGSTAFLHGERPTVLELDRPLTLAADLGPIVGPASLGEAAEWPRRMGAFNPSIVAIDAWDRRQDRDDEWPRWTGLCPRCAYVATLRVDALHQCDDSTPLNYPKKRQRASWFRGTALLVLDAQLRTLAQTWLVTSPMQQVGAFAAAKHWTADFGVADAFAPPWSSPRVFDVRLLNVDGRLLATYVCQRCRGMLCYAISSYHVCQRCRGAPPQSRAVQSTAEQDHGIVGPVHHLGDNADPERAVCRAMAGELPLMLVHVTGEPTQHSIGKSSLCYAPCYAMLC